MKVLFMVGTMFSGGAERVISEMSNYWVEQGIEVIIATTNVTKDKQDFYALDKRIKRVDLTVKKKFIVAQNKLSILTTCYRIRKLVQSENPTVTISFISQLNILTILSLLGVKVPLIISDRLDPYLDTVSLFSKKILYPFSDKLIIQTLGSKKFYAEIKNLDIGIIPNPISKPKINTQKKHKYFKTKSICAIGRFDVRHKGFDLLIEAFSLVEQAYPEWNLVIFGEGKDRELLENMIEEKALNDRVFLPGRIDNPRNIIVDADIFVLSSLKEGFPNVLAEAMSVELACISFDCNFGPAEIIEHNESGLLVDKQNVQALSGAMKRLMEDIKLREHLGKNAKIRISKMFSIDKVMKQWEEEIQNLISKDIK